VRKEKERTNLESREEVAAEIKRGPLDKRELRR